MQSGYGVSEMQQLVMVDGICSSFFPVAATATANADLSPQQKQHHNHTVHQPHPSFYHHQQQQLQYHHFNGFLKQQHQEQHPSATPPSVAAVTQQRQQHHHQQLEQQRFQSHFQHPLPFTQQLFEQTHQFHLFNQEQQARLHNQHPPHSIGLDPHHQRPSSPQNSASPPRIDVCSTGGGRIPSFFGPSMNFRLSVNDGNSDGGGAGDGLDDEDAVNGSERRWPPLPTSRGEEDSAIKEPFWRPLDLDLDLDCINGNNKRCKEKNNHHNQQEQQEHQVDLEIPSAKRFKETINAAAEDGTNYKLFSELEAICNNNQTGSSSALTGENTQITLNDPPMIEDHDADEGVERRHHTGLMRVETTDDDGSKGVVDKESRRRRRRKRRKQHLSSIAAFFQTLVKQLLDHQESLNRKFLDVMEKKEKERTAMEEAWKQQQATKIIMEAKERKEQQAIAAKREATIISFIEKITGETITLPPKPQFQSYPQEEQDDDNDNNLNQEASNNTNSPNCAISSSNRWPKAEVQALIRARSQLETRFQEPGLKGPLWEEVSSVMASMGYRRDAKRCKEKWENINKYFRKAKESTKKRPHHSKTCSYFHLLDQLYSRTPITTAAIAATENTDVEQRGNNSELLDAIVVSKYSEMIHLNLDFGPNDLNVADEDDKQEDDDHEVEGEGESDLGATKPVHEEGMNCIQSSFQELEHTRSTKL